MEQLLINREPQLPLVSWSKSYFSIVRMNTCLSTGLTRWFHTSSLDRATTRRFVYLQVTR